MNTTWQHIRRSPYQALAAIMIMTLTFFTVSLFAYLFYSSFVILGYFETRPQIIAFFKEEIKSDELNQLKNKLNETDKVTSLKYVSKKEALAIYREQNKNDPLLLEMVTASILPDSLEVSAIQPGYLSELAGILKKETNVDKVSFPEEVINVVISLTNSIRMVGISLIAFLTVNSLLVVFTIVSMKISLKKEEIEILRLIGASKSYIRQPFILEGIFYGIVAAILGSGFCSLIIYLITPNIAPALSGIPLLPLSIIVYASVLGGTIFFGLLLGIISSLIAVLRYLKN